MLLRVLDRLKKTRFYSTSIRGGKEIEQNLVFFQCIRDYLGGEDGNLVKQGFDLSVASRPGGTREKGKGDRFRVSTGGGGSVRGEARVPGRGKSL